MCVVLLVKTEDGPLGVLKSKVKKQKIRGKRCKNMRYIVQNKSGTAASINFQALSDSLVIDSLFKV